MIRSTRQESRGVGGVGGVGVGVEAGAGVAELELTLPGGVLRKVRAGAGVCVIGVPAARRQDCTTGSLNPGQCVRSGRSGAGGGA